MTDLTGLGTWGTAAGKLIDAIAPKSETPEERMQLTQTAENIIVAEMTQSDNYTKRGRPTIIYAGLAFIFLVHVFAPILFKLLIFAKANVSVDQLAQLQSIQKLSLPAEFWWAWGSVVSIYSIGRTWEKNGANQGILGKVTSLITGNK